MPIKPYICSFEQLAAELKDFPLVLNHLADFCTAGICESETEAYVVFYHKDVDLCYVYILSKGEFPQENFSGVCGGTWLYKLTSANLIQVPREVEYQLGSYLDVVGPQIAEELELFAFLRTTLVTTCLRLKATLALKSVSFGYDEAKSFGLILRLDEGKIQDDDKIFAVIIEVLPLLRPQLAKFGLRMLAEQNLYSLSFTGKAVVVFVPLTTLLSTQGGGNFQLN